MKLAITCHGLHPPPQMRAQVAMDRCHVVAVAQGGRGPTEIASCQCPVYNEPSRSPHLYIATIRSSTARVSTIIS